MANELDQEMMMPPTSGMADEMYSQSIDDIQNQSLMINKIPGKLRRYIEMDNIAESLDEDQLIKIESVVSKSYEVDKESRYKWDSLMKGALTLIYDHTRTKDSPWEGSANIKYPMVLQGCIHYNSNMLPEIIKNEKVVEARLIAPDDDTHQFSDRAGRLSAHMSYQLLGQSDHWKSDLDRLLMILPMYGICYTKSFFNSITGMPDTELCLPMDVIVNNNVKSLKSATRITHEFMMTTNELIENMKKGLFYDYPIDDLFSGEAHVVNEKGKEIESSRVPSFSTDKKLRDDFYDMVHPMLEQHRYLDLDGDGYQEPYIVTIHKDSHKTMRIVARYDESTFEFDDDGKFVKINPILHFNDYHFIPNPDGSFHSLGFGILLYPLNETVNSVLNQLLDAGVLANRQCGFIGKDLRTPKGDLNFRPGEWKQVVSAPGTTIAQNIYPLPVKEPSQTLFALLQFLIDSSRGITAISEIMSGEMPPPNTPVGTVMALVEQGQKVYSAILERVYEGLKKEFTKLYEINKKYLKEEETFPLAQQRGMVSIQDYLAPNYGIFPVADPRLSSSMQRNMQAQALLQLEQYPEINKYEVLRNYLEVLKVKNPETYINKPDPNAPPPMAEQLAEAQKRNVEMDTAMKLMENELKAWSIAIDEMKVKSQSAYWGGELATDKIDSIAKIAALERETTDAEIERAATAEEAITKGTQLQDVPTDIHQRLSGLENLVTQSLMGAQGQMGGGNLPPESQQQPSEV